MDDIVPLTSAQSSFYHSLPIWLLGMHRRKKSGQLDIVRADEAPENRAHVDETPTLGVSKRSRGGQEVGGLYFCNHLCPVFFLPLSSHLVAWYAQEEKKWTARESPSR